jgi:hypothetical protein
MSEQLLGEILKEHPVFSEMMKEAEKEKKEEKKIRTNVEVENIVPNRKA